MDRQVRFTVFCVFRQLQWTILYLNGPCQSYAIVCHFSLTGSREMNILQILSILSKHSFPFSCLPIFACPVSDPEQARRIEGRFRDTSSPLKWH